MQAIQTRLFYVEPLDIILIVLALSVLIPLGYLYGKRLVAVGLDIDTAFQKGARPWLFLAGFIGICAAIAMVYKFPAWFSPAWLAYLESASWVMAKSGPLFLAGVAIPLGAAVGKRRDVVILFTLALLATVGVQAVQSTFLRPISPTEIHVRHAADGSILQSTNSTCTAAALANALRHFDIEASEQEVARILGTRKTGTTEYQVLNGVKRYGLFGHFVSVKAQHLARIKRPAVVSVMLPQGILHSILVYDADAKGNLEVIDPLAGKGKYVPERYQKMLERPEGVVLTDAPIPTINRRSPRYQIAFLQGALQAEQYLTQISGVWDQDTQSAVKKFQTDYALQATGEVDELTWLMITGPHQTRQKSVV